MLTKAQLQCESMQMPRPCFQLPVNGACRLLSIRAHAATEGEFEGLSERGAATQPQGSYPARLHIYAL